MLMLTLEDACKVLKNLDCIKDGWKSDPDNPPDDYDPEFPWTYIRDSMEQKCYSMTGNTTEGDFIERIDAATDIQNISEHIGKGDLKEWLEVMRNNMTAELRILLDTHEEHGA